jgi:hypothetical protein
VEDVAAARFVGLDDLAAIEFAAELAQRVEQATRVASNAASILARAAVKRDSQPTVP